MSDNNDYIKQEIPSSDESHILPLDLETEMKKSFISYAMAVIINRALPDVRDGLKPVHRRILFGMDELGVQPDKPTRKSARIVGDVMGKYHPHGDASIYDAMVRLAQDFNMRYPLVKGQGNFGSLDGDGAAAPRYTEAKLDKLSSLMLRDIEKNTVDFYPNFDETLMQPRVLPSRFPNLLANGSGGIAVGMATNIPPHNLSEVIDAYVAMIDDPDITTDELMQYIKGPDFPTGGIIMGTAGIKQAYRTGRGRIVVRAKTEIEDFGRDRQRIIVTEIPFQVNKARMVESIAKLVHDKRIEGISALRDESNRNGIRIVIELKTGVNANVILNQLYKHTSLQDTFGAIMLALVDDEPKILTLRDMLKHYLDFQKEVVTRRSVYELERAKERLHILLGLLIALDNIDEVIHIIRSSESDSQAKARLIERFSLSEKQAQAILDMRLRRLTGLERGKIESERDSLIATIDWLNLVLSDNKVLLGIIRDEISEVRSAFHDERRTRIEYDFDASDIDLEDIIQEEEMIVTLTQYGYIKRIAADTYRAQNRGGKGVRGQTTREEDFVVRMFATSTHSQIMFFTNRGRAFRMKCYMIPEAGRQAKGTAIVNLLQLSPGETITAVFPVESNDGYLVMATRRGIIKKTALMEFDNIRRGGIIAQTLKDDDELIGVLTSTGDDELIIATRRGMAIRFHESDVRPMGRSAAGVYGIRLEDDDRVIDIQKIKKGQDVLVITDNGLGKRTNEDAYRLQSRGGKGVTTMNITEKTGLLRSMRVVDGDEDLLIVRTDGTVLRIPMEQISVISRNTQGVRIMKVNDETHVASVTTLSRSDENPETDTDAETETDTATATATDTDTDTKE